MTSEEARIILTACRPGVADESDPAIAEALVQVGRDPELARWWAEERAFDEAIAAHLASAPEPFGLKTRLLANAPAARKSRTLRWATLLATGAALLLLLGQVILLNRSTSAAGAGLTDFRREMISFVRLQPPLEMQSARLAPIKQWLAQSDAPPASNVPPRLAAMETMGCRILSFRGRKVTLICFCDGPKIAHLFIVDRAALPGIKPGRAPVFAKEGAWMTASWVDQGRVYTFAMKGDEQQLRQLLGRA